MIPSNEEDGFDYRDVTTKKQTVSGDVVTMTTDHLVTRPILSSILLEVQWVLDAIRVPPIYKYGAFTHGLSDKRDHVGLAYVKRQQGELEGARTSRPALTACCVGSILSLSPVEPDPADGPASDKKSGPWSKVWKNQAIEETIKILQYPLQQLTSWLRKEEQSAAIQQDSAELVERNESNDWTSSRSLNIRQW